MKQQSDKLFSIQKSAFTLIEVIVSLAVLCIIFTFLLHSIRGRHTETEVSVHFFTAACVAQKVVEDLENRCLVNPYTLDILPHTFEFTPTEDDPFFSLLEDSNQDGRIDTGLDLSAGASELTERLKQLNCTLTIERGFTNGCAKVDLLITWNQEGNKKEYNFSHLLPDLPNHLTESTFSLVRPSLTDKAVAASLFDEDKPLDELLAAFAMDKQTAYQLVELQQISRIAITTLDSRNQKLQNLLNSPRIKTVDGVVTAAELYEGNAMLTLQTYFVLLPLVENIERRRAAKTFNCGILFLNAKAQHLYSDIACLADRVDGRSNDGNLSMQFNLNLLSAMEHYSSLCLDPVLATITSPRKTAAAAIRVANIATTIAQNDACRMVLSSNGKTTTMRGRLIEELQRLTKLSEGRDYNLSAFLKSKVKAISTSQFHEYEEIGERLTVMAGVSGSLSNLLKDITKSN
jgi:prepilin-type N-terminal cleavage/methylation domain-containing protein